MKLSSKLLYVIYRGKQHKLEVYQCSNVFMLQQGYQLRTNKKIKNTFFFLYSDSKLRQPW